MAVRAATTVRRATPMGRFVALYVQKRKFKLRHYQREAKLAPASLDVLGSTQQR
jgi:hypothetical protein